MTDRRARVVSRPSIEQLGEGWRLGATGGQLALECTHQHEIRFGGVVRNVLRDDRTILAARVAGHSDVVRAGSDPDVHIRETREDDNTSYTYFRVDGDDIEVLERGIGESPWDRRKTIVDDTRRPTRWTE